MSSIQNQLSTGKENRTKVILSTYEPSYREFSTAINSTSPSSRRKSPFPPLLATRSNVPFRRRVSFSDSVIGLDHCRGAIMQNDTSKSYYDNGQSDTKARQTFYDIWQADDLVDKIDDGYENTLNINNYFVNRVSGCTINKDQRSSENIDEIVDSNIRAEWRSKSDVYPADHVTESRESTVGEHDNLANEDVLNHKDIDLIDHDEYRMRGGCGGCCNASCENVRKSLQEHNSRGGPCCCGKHLDPNESCSPREAESSRDAAEAACTANAACTMSRCCCCRPGYRVVCRKTARCAPPCTTGAQSCGSSGCCVSECRGGCGKPGQTCMPSRRACTSPARSQPHSSHGRSPCARPCCPQTPCPSAGRSSGLLVNCGGYCGRSYECGRSQSPRCRTIISSRCCMNGVKRYTDGACCRLKLSTVCECLGGGLDCQRCGKKVYQAEMQIASGVPYHSSCFSCFCCRKPLEPLTYQENCGEIYCKQCYVRNFGPQGYGYGAGAGVLQTSL